MATRTDLAPPPDAAERIQELRMRHGLTQARLAELLGVSHVSLNRWENGQTRPSPMAWQRIARAEADGLLVQPEATEPSAPDFHADPRQVAAVVEAERLAYGHLFNPLFATEISRVDPLPHQRIAVYEHMVSQPRLRFLLADDAGAGKTIMTGLYVREMLTRRLLKRVLIVPPAGLVGNWERELRQLFSLRFRILSGADARAEDPFGDEGDLAIVSVDTLAGERLFSRLQQARPYDLVVFDEAHKLSANRDAAYRVRKTDRYRLAEAVAGISSAEPRWSLDWSARHLLLLTATPHMGKDLPYYYLWRLLEPEVLSTPEAFEAYPPDARRRHFLRRTKEEMVSMDGSPLYPLRVCDTLSYHLTTGEAGEQRLYDETTAYLRGLYSRSPRVNSSATQLAVTVFQRRLASSTFALMRSMERQLDRVARRIQEARSGRLQPAAQRPAPSPLDDKTADEERAEDGREENEAAEDAILAAALPAQLAELEVERQQVESLLSLARRVLNTGEESKFERLRDVLRDPESADEKLLIFTEHRDTLDFLVRRMEGLGYTGQIARIHGGMDYREREEQVEFFRTPVRDGGAACLVATDAAGEGINLQFCWRMVNYDVPWNPARLEQRMGRIHRYGQKHDPVCILNLTSADTREGMVLHTLLDKLERIRKELKSDKVFDVVGRLFQEVSLRDYMEQALLGQDGARSVAAQIEGRLTAEQVLALREKEQRLYGDGGDVVRELPRLREQLDREVYRRLLPGYVRRFTERAGRLLGFSLVDNGDNTCSLSADRAGALDLVWSWLEAYPSEVRERLTFERPGKAGEAVFLHPGEPVFERIRSQVLARFEEAAFRGATFVDAGEREAYRFHVAEVSVVRRDEGREEVLERRLVGIRENRDGSLDDGALEQLLLLKPTAGPAPAGDDLASRPLHAARGYLVERVVRPMAESRRQELLRALPERETFLARGFDYEEAELLEARRRFRDKAATGDEDAAEEMARVRERQRQLSQRRQQAMDALQREPESIGPGEVRFLAHALVVPSSDPADVRLRQQEIETIAMRLARAHEEALGAAVMDVCTPEGARAAGLGDHPGFDLHSHRPQGEERCIEVKGRARGGDVEMSDNEFARACILRERYWLYAVYDCATSWPRVVRIQDPWGRLLRKDPRGVVLSEQSILEGAEEAE